MQLLHGVAYLVQQRVLLPRLLLDLHPVLLCRREGGGGAAGGAGQVGRLPCLVLVVCCWPFQ